MSVAALTLALSTSACGGRSAPAERSASQQSTGGIQIVTVDSDTPSAGSDFESSSDEGVDDGHLPPPSAGGGATATVAGPSFEEDYQELLQMDRATSSALSSGRPDCEAAENLVERICALADRICEISEHSDGDGARGASPAARCEDASTRCQSNRQRVESACN